MIDSCIDTYIQSAAPFAQPILTKLRQLIHRGCPDVVETIKWGMPFFEYKGPLCNFAAFKQHCSFGFWKASLIVDPKNYLQPQAAHGGEAMGNLGKISSLKNLIPEKIFIDFIKQAVKLNEDGIKIEKTKKTPAKGIKPSNEFQISLNKNKKAKSNFDKFSPSQRNEYIGWINEAKTEVTKNKRIATSIEWIEVGKRRNWKYEKKK